MIPTIGRIVHYRIGGPDDYPTLRPAIMVQVFGGPPATMANLTVFLDGLNDFRNQPSAWRIPPGVVMHDQIHLAVGSATEGQGIGEWRWPAKVSA